MCFPEDLLQNNREYYTDITFMEYSASQQMNSTPIMSVGNSVKLPLPRRLNDFTAQNWEEWSATSAGINILNSLSSMIPEGNMAMGAVSSLAGAGASGASTYFGLALNPAQFMMYKRPSYKEHELTWMLAASTPSDSRTLKKIIDEMKMASMPSISGFGSALWKYPKTCMITVKPNDYTFKFRPAAIIAVSVDYHGSGGPSYFKSGAPTIVNLTLRLKEISFWTQDNYQR